MTLSTEKSPCIVSTVIHMRSATTHPRHQTALKSPETIPRVLNPS